MLISKKIWLLIAIALVTCAAVSGIGLFGLKQVNANVSEIAKRSMPAVLATGDMRTTYLSIIPSVYELATASDATLGASLEEKIKGDIQKLIKMVNEYSARTTDEEEKKALDQAKLGLVSFISKMRQISALAKSGESQMAVEVIQRDVGPLHTRLSTGFDKLVKINVDNANSVVGSADSTFSRTTGISVVASVFGLSVIGILGLLLGRSITKPLGVMQRAIIQTANQLVFTDTITVHSNDEIGRTLKAYNELLARLRLSFGEIQNASARMTNITDEVDKTTKEIAANSHTQSEASADMAAAVEQLTVSISMVANQAQDASFHTKSSHDKADQGAEVILSTVKGIQTIAESVSEASSRIDELRNDSESVSSVANIIKDIADQTNLLALNAAIEAARAGEQGRGFAVVADEVRKLSERTSRSTQEISALLAKMQTNAVRAVDSMGAVVRQVDSGVALARLAGDSIHSIKEGSQTVVKAVEEITEAVREQSTASTAISRRIEQIAQMTDRNSVATEATAEAVHRMNDMSHEIATALAAYKV